MWSGPAVWTIGGPLCGGMAAAEAERRWIDRTWVIAQVFGHVSAQTHPERAGTGSGPIRAPVQPQCVARRLRTVAHPQQLEIERFERHPAVPGPLRGITLRSAPTADGRRPTADG